MKKIIITLTIVMTFLLLQGFICEASYLMPQGYTPSNAPFGDYFGDWGDGSSSTTGIDIVMANLVLQTLASALLYFAAPVAIAMLVFAGYTMIMGGESSEKQEQGKKHLQWTLLGLLAIILSYSIVRIAIMFILSAAQQSAPPGAK